MKPDCRLCVEKPRGLTSLLGREVTEQLLYGFFNAGSLSSRRKEGLDIDEIVRSHMEGMDDGEEGGLEGYSGWMRQYVRWQDKLKGARRAAWDSIVEKLMMGEVDPEDIPLAQMMKHFPDMLAEELRKEGLLEFVSEKYVYQNSYVFHALTARSENVVAKKVLEEAFARLKRIGLGIHELSEAGTGTYPSSDLREFDEFSHSYDMLDVQETLLSVATRDPEDMCIEERDLKARIPLHKARSSNVILLDKSGSMNGNKIRGAIMATLGLRSLLESEFKEDRLQIVAYDHVPFILRSGEIMRLRANSWTDIGRALDMSREILADEDSNRNVFLVTDSEPTISCYPDQSPEKSALRASYMLGSEGISLNIVMLDRRPELRALCERMAFVNRNATVAFVDDPLDLTEFIVKTYVDLKRTAAS